jgi:CRP/FNR family cyclic AMP-dependent transcriptional regulator
VLEPVKTIEIFQKTPSPKTFSAGEVVFQEGKLGDAIYGIISGEVEILVNGKVVETIQKGDVFGEGALIHLNHQRDSTAIAKTDSLLAFLDREHFLFAVQQTPMFALEVMKSYSDRLRRLRHILSDLERDISK